MASMKAEKPVGTQLFGQVKKEPAKTSTATTTPKAPASKSTTPKKATPKPQEPKKKTAKGGKSAASSKSGVKA